MKAMKLLRRAWVHVFGWHGRWVPAWKLSDLHDYPEHPIKPCHSCTGDSAVVKSYEPDGGKITYKTSWEWCSEVGTCAATIDWDEVYGSG